MKNKRAMLIAQKAKRTSNVLAALDKARELEFIEEAVFLPEAKKVRRNAPVAQSIERYIHKTIEETQKFIDKTEEE